MAENGSRGSQLVCAQLTETKEGDRDAVMLLFARFYLKPLSCLEEGNKQKTSQDARRRMEQEKLIETTPEDAENCATPTKCTIAK